MWPDVFHEQICWSLSSSLFSSFQAQTSQSRHVLRYSYHFFPGTLIPATLNWGYPAILPCSCDLSLSTSILPISNHRKFKSLSESRLCSPSMKDQTAANASHDLQSPCTASWLGYSTYALILQLGIFLLDYSLTYRMSLVNCWNEWAMRRQGRILYILLWFQTRRHLDLLVA